MYLNLRNKISACRSVVKLQTYVGTPKSKMKKQKMHIDFDV